jgi:hypothetical protein
MATVAQLNAMVDAGRKEAFAEISQKVPSFFQSEAEGFVTNDELLHAMKILAAAYEGAAKE